MCFNVTINEDIVDETTEHFFLHISSASPSVDSFAGSISKITILDNDGKATICCIHVSNPPPASFSHGALVLSLLGHNRNLWQL